ncbi:unnamed protein product [Moneuplotes crassus]|uniref:non-specific serine/threonine protein kinase n=1 Tax=Euplotes crassus TaxID=5936 RepID=A0AAD1XAP6_EUPCR|nr:unnamed protein product [Moneuplotes crassus]
MDSKAQKKPESYKKIKEIGKGACGKAYLVQAETSKEYAVIKQIDVNQYRSKSEREKVYLEAKVMEGLKHKYIVGFKEVYKTKSNKVCIVMEYADGGDLASKIRKYANARKHMSEETVLDMFTQICLALKHIHDRKIIHRDIKAQNIFLNKNGDIKFGDFGVCRVLDATFEKAKTGVGTPYYIAPEILNDRPSYTNKADIWSLGILLFELCKLDVPIKAAGLPDLYRKIKNFRTVPSLPRQYSKDMSDLIKSMLITTPSKRPSVVDLLAHPCLSSRVSKFLSQEEQNEEFSHTVIHNFDILNKKKKGKAPLGRPISARNAKPPMVEEAKGTPKSSNSKMSSGASKKTPGGFTPRKISDKFSRPGSANKFARQNSAGSLGVGSRQSSAKKALGVKDFNKPAQTPKLGLGARKFSAGALHARKNSHGFAGRNSPSKQQKYSFGDKYGKPSPSQTPKAGGGAKKLGAKAPIGFQRPSSARAAGAQKANGFGGGYAGGVNNRRLF